MDDLKQDLYPPDWLNVIKDKLIQWMAERAFQNLLTFKFLDAQERFLSTSSRAVAEALGELAVGEIVTVEGKRVLSYTINTDKPSIKTRIDAIVNTNRSSKALKRKASSSKTTTKMNSKIGYSHPNTYDDDDDDEEDELEDSENIPWTTDAYSVGLEVARLIDRCGCNQVEYGKVRLYAPSNGIRDELFKIQWNSDDIDDIDEYELRKGLETFGKWRNK